MAVQPTCRVSSSGVGVIRREEVEAMGLLVDLLAVLVVVEVAVETARDPREVVSRKCPLQNRDSGIVVARLLAPL